MRKRLLSLWFPHLAAERTIRTAGLPDPDAPFATVAMRKSALRLSSLNMAAARALNRDMPLADARALLPSLATVAEDPEREAAFLRALARWAMRYTPTVALDGADGLTLDVSGCAHLFGGEAAMVEDMGAQLGAKGLSMRAGLADTRGAGWALARFGGETIGIVPTGRTREAVAALPVAALGIETGTVATLMRLGLKHIGDLGGLPRASLARRFGMDLVARLDRLHGEAPEPLDTEGFVAPHAVRLSLPDPIGRTGDVHAALLRLLERLCERLTREGRGARRLRLSFRRVDGGGDRAEIGLGRAMRDPVRIAALFDAEIDGFDAGFGIDMVRLEAVVTEPMTPAQLSTAEQRSAQDDALADLVARLGNRIGFEHVTRFLPAESHIPERAFTVAAAAYSQAERFGREGPARPFVLFPPEPVESQDAAHPPQLFRWRGARFETREGHGPERIAPEWWLDDPAWRSGPRDYWRVQTMQGRRLWLFHARGGERPGGWFAQGEFA